ncbi:MAG: response regulator transcription factor [Actinobacteria bacterium]|nr:response regulator transcription factor [Actinomycetota bacterium]
MPGPSVNGSTAIDDAAIEAPRIVVAVVHPTMRRYICDLIEQGCQCWIATSGPDPDELQQTVLALRPDVVVLEAAQFPASYPRIVEVVPASRIVVIGRYADEAYRDAAMAAGAGDWISRDELSSRLAPVVQRITSHAGCRCGCAHLSPQQQEDDQ